MSLQGEREVGGFASGQRSKDELGDAPLVWYAAYGSNLLHERFMAYLRGGPVPGADLAQHGARDDSDPIEDRPHLIDRPLSFGFSSRRWEGRGVCFVDPDRVVPGATLGRAWLVTSTQLADTWAQENGEKVGPPIDLDRLADDGHLDLPRGWYRRLLHLGTLAGRPIATITCDAMPEANAAGMAYLGVVGRGVMETHGLSPTEAAAYLSTCPGNAGVVDPGELTSILSD